MMFRKLNLFLALISSVVLLSACEGNTSFVKVLKNQSTRNITVLVNAAPSASIDTVSVLAGEEKELFVWDKLGGTKEAGPCTEELTGLEFILPAGDSLLLDAMNNGNWIVEWEKLGTANYRHTCTLVLKDSDFR